MPPSSAPPAQAWGPAEPPSKVRAPPRARELDIGLLDNFDDDALRTFLDPADGGVDPEVLGIALRGCSAALLRRVGGALPRDARGAFEQANRREVDAAAGLRARRRVIEQLFWPLVYWNDPDDYEELVAGERVHPRVLDVLDLDGREVCDIGAGAGRFTLTAVKRARRVIAVDMVTPLLERLRRNARAAGVANLEVRRGRFTALPLADACVDVAVACSSFTTSGPHGGDRALAEAERIVRPGGEVAVIWPQDPAWFRARGFTHISVRGSDAVQFRDARTAERLCARYYSRAAARWVRRNGATEVPYAVLGVTPPNDLCVKRVGAPTPSR